MQLTSSIKKLLDFLKVMNFSSEMMHNLMMDLLDFAQIEKNTFKLNKDFFSLYEVIDSAFQLVNHMAESKGVLLVAPE